MKILVPASMIDELLPHTCQLVPTATLLPYDDTTPLPAGFEEAEAILRTFGVHRWSQIVATAPRIRWMHTVSAGVDNLLTPAIRAKSDFVLTDSGPAFTAVIPEFVLGWILQIARRYPKLIEQQREHKWQSLPQEEVWGKTIGIIGLGPIGLGIASRAQAFGLRTIGLRQRPLPAALLDEVVTGRDGLNYLLEASDFIVIAAALTPETRHIIGAEQIARMKLTAWIINIARGAHIDQAALIDALQAGRIGGACLDVFEQEPLPPDSPLWDLPNVYIAPHNSNGGRAPTVRVRQRTIFLDNLKRFAGGLPLENAVDFTLGY